MFSILQNQINVTDIVNKSSVSFFITKVAKKNSKTWKDSCCSRQNHCMTCKKSTDQLQYFKKFYLTFINHHLARLA